MIFSQPNTNLVVLHYYSFVKIDREMIRKARTLMCRMIKVNIILSYLKQLITFFPENGSDTFSFVASSASSEPKADVTLLAPEL